MTHENLDQLAAVLQDLHDEERTAREQGNTDLADRLRTQRRKLLEPPPADLGQLLFDIADGLETMLETSLTPGTLNHELTEDLVTEMRKTVPRIPPNWPGPKPPTLSAMELDDEDRIPTLHNPDTQFVTVSAADSVNGPGVVISLETDDPELDCDFAIAAAHVDKLIALLRRVKLDVT
jgi:hypothetical protein